MPAMSPPQESLEEPTGPDSVPSEPSGSEPLSPASCRSDEVLTFGPVVLVLLGSWVHPSIQNFLDSILLVAPPPQVAHLVSQVTGGGVLSVHDVTVAVGASPHGPQGAPAPPLQHLLQVGAGSASLAVAVCPTHQAVKALWVRGEAWRF